MKPLYDIAVLVTILRQLERRCGQLEAEQSQTLENLSLKQLEALSVALLDFNNPEDLSKWIDDRGWEIYEAELVEQELKKPKSRGYISSIEEVTREKIAGNMIQMNLQLSKKEISRLTDVPIEIVNEIHSELIQNGGMV